jgi:hypothetical protein
VRLRILLGKHQRRTSRSTAYHTMESLSAIFFSVSSAYTVVCSTHLINIY